MGTQPLLGGDSLRLSTPVSYQNYIAFFWVTATSTGILLQVPQHVGAWFIQAMAASGCSLEAFVSYNVTAFPTQGQKLSSCVTNTSELKSEQCSKRASVYKGCCNINGSV